MIFAQNTPDGTSGCIYLHDNPRPQKEPETEGSTRRFGLLENAGLRYRDPMGTSHISKSV